MKETLIVANSSMMWLLSIVIISTVVVQTIIFYKMAKKQAEESQLLEKEQIKKALKIGVIGTMGPAVAVFAIAVALIAQVGGPLTLARVGVIGSAAFEFIAAQIGSAGTVGTEQFGNEMLAAASWVMTLGGAGWLIMTFFATKHISSFQETLKKTNPLTIAYMASFAPFVIFATLSYKEVTKGMKKGSYAQLAALIAGAIVVVVINKIVERDASKKWLKEWAMGFAVIAAMIVGTLVS